MARPSVLTYLSTGKLIDTFNGFVDTFNYILDFIENLSGEGELDKSKSITIDRSVPDHPVIRGGGSGGGEVEITDTEENTVKGSKIKLASADDANIEVHASKNTSTGVVTLEMGAYYL